MLNISAVSAGNLLGFVPFSSDLTTSGLEMIEKFLR
jgi:hypothetical protein